jgi:hypothetical protein
MNTNWKRWGLRGSAIGIAALATTLGLGAAVSSASPSQAAHAAGHATDPPVVTWSNNLKTNTNGWCTFASGCNGDQTPTTYGTIDVLPSTFSNYGGYAPSARGPVGQTGSYARVSGSGDTLTGCYVSGVSSPGTENCSGPYTTFGSDDAATTFPTNGFTTSIKIYLSRAWAAANPGQVVDWDTALNNSSASFLEDFVFNMCTTATDGGGFYVSTSNGAGGCSTGPGKITGTGWYTFKIDFTPVAGDVAAKFSILNVLNHTVVAPTTEDTANATSSVGGPAYGWLPDEDILGLPIAGSSLTVNS